MTDAISAAIEGAGAYLTEHPDEARYTDSLATARVESGLRVRVDGPNGEVLETDMPAAVGGAWHRPGPGLVPAGRDGGVRRLAGGDARRAARDRRVLAARSTSTPSPTIAASSGSMHRFRAVRSRCESASGWADRVPTPASWTRWPRGRWIIARFRMRCVGRSRCG